MADFYAAMDLFCFPSTRECAPIVAKEALSWQMPVLMRDLPEYCGMYGGVRGIHFMQGYIEEVSSTIVRLLADCDIGLSDIYAKLGKPLQRCHKDQEEMNHGDIE